MQDEKDSKKFNVPAMDLSALNSIYANPAPVKNISSGPDFISHNARGRDFTARLSFNTGLFWIGGFASGGAYGFVEGWRTAASPNYKIRFNSVMNAISRRGSVLGSSLGILGR
jgi:hypothetical protein